MTRPRPVLSKIRHMSEIAVKILPSRDPAPISPPAHWVGGKNPPTHFTNPWPSFQKHGFVDILRTRFSPNRNFVPVPADREGLVKIRKPDWGRSQPNWEKSLKATWLGHAGFLVEMPSISEGQRGLRILFDAVFSERTSPFSFLGPKRYTPTPCELSELPEIDIIIISHNHYDHLDIHTVRPVCEAQKAAGRHVQIFAGLNNKPWFLSSGLGLGDDDVHDCDWWEERQLTIDGVGSVRLTGLPAQHTSGRTPFDAGQTLWCSWAVEDVLTGKKLYFAGDTAYKSTSSEIPCPAFDQIGKVFGHFDLALLPIGLYSPREVMSSVHTDPEGSLEIHKAINSKLSIGKHYGTVRGGISQYYEDVLEPPRRWQECCEKEGRWGIDCRLCDVGETVSV